MASIRVKRREPCAYEDCGSKRFHLGDDGYTYCDQGHQQAERGTVIAEDTGELVIHGRKSKRKGSDAESATSKGSSFSGARAGEHYLLCVQLILRKQLRWLIDVQKLPEELETLVRDLWALQLQKLRNNVSYESETDTEPPSSQVFSSQSESERSTTSHSSRRSSKRDAKPQRDSPKLIETLVLCHIGILLLRIPVTVADVHAWTNTGELLYYRASRDVPLGMRERLPGRYQDMLEPQDVLQAQALHQIGLKLLAMLHEEFGMDPPRLNTPLVIYRWIRDLGLPLEVFAASQRLARILDIETDYKFADKAGSRVVLRYPEAQLMALVVVSTKLLFPFDGPQRYPMSATDLSALSLDWDVWIKVQQGQHDRELDQSSLTFEQAFKFTESDCLEAADEKLDAYLDWCEENIASEEIRQRGRASRDADFRKALFKMFPIRPKQPAGNNSASHGLEDEAVDKLRHIQSTLVPKRVVESDSAGRQPNRPGSLYRRFRKAEELDGPAQMFFDRAAKLAGLSLDGMVQAVFLTEKILQKHEDAVRQAAAQAG